MSAYAPSTRVVRDIDRARSELSGFHQPQPGETVRLQGYGHDEWVLVYVHGQIHVETTLKNAGEKCGLSRVSYATSTWVVQRTTDKDRNDVWTDPSRNMYGEGEYEQRRVVVTRDDRGRYKYWPYYDSEDEIQAIEKSIGKSTKQMTTSPSVARYYRCSNRVSGAKLSDNPNAAGWVCRISDYLYFSDVALAMREKSVAETVAPGETAPVYTREFDKYAGPELLVAAQDAEVPVVSTPTQVKKRQRVDVSK